VRRAFALLALGAALLAAGNAGGAGAKPIVIGVTISQTGPNAGTAGYVLQGYQRWVGDANHHGGLLGRPIQLRVYDDHSDPATAASLYRKLITEDKVDLVTGPYASAVNQAVIPVTEELHRVLIGQTAGTSLFDGTQYAVQGLPQGSTYLPGAADIAKNAGYKTVALLANDGAGTLEICAGLRSRAQADGLTVVLDRSYPRTTTDFTAYAAAAKAAGADVVAGCSLLNDSISLAKALNAAGVRPKLEVFSIGPTDPTFGTALGPNAEGVVGSTTWWPSLKTKGNADFVASFTRTFHRAPTYQAASAYATLQVLAAAVRQVGSLDQAKIRAGLGRLTRQTVAGTFKLDSSGHQTGFSSYLMQWQNGTQKLVWPAADAEASVRLPG
jgi:branched-chain amino acid transport system substrate-binding protein